MREEKEARKKELDDALALSFGKRIMLSMRVNLWPGKTDWQKTSAMRCIPWQALILCLFCFASLIGEKMDSADEGVTSDELMEKIGRVEQCT